MNLLEEIIEDDAVAQDELNDKEAEIGYKTQQDLFYGYKTHLAINGKGL